jgi:hypothetical protein
MNRRTLLLAAPALALLPALPTRAQAGPMLDVAKDPYCGCCDAWADLARAAGYAVSVREVDDMAAIKAAAGVPDALWSCHTARLTTPEGRTYAVEGHVPFEALDRLMTEAPDFAGLSVPGMPMGSPGMGDDPGARYDVLAWGGSAGIGTLFMAMGRG